MDRDNAFERLTACRQYPDPYVLNSKGNVLASLGRWRGKQPYHTAHHLCECMPLQGGYRWSAYMDYCSELSYSESP